MCNILSSVSSSLETASLSERSLTSANFSCSQASACPQHSLTFTSCATASPHVPGSEKCLDDTLQAIALKEDTQLTRLCCFIQLTADEFSSALNNITVKCGILEILKP